MYFQESEEPEDKEKDDKGIDKMTERLMKSRTIVIADTITKQLSQKVFTQLILLEQENPEEVINIFINSPGGDADAGFAVYDMMKFVKPEVRSICAGVTASAAVIILLGSKRENRYSLPNSRILIHQPSTGVQGTASDIQIEAGEIIKCREKINKLIAEETKQDVQKVENDTKRNYWMSANEAVEYGLVSKIVRSKEDYN